MSSMLDLKGIRKSHDDRPVLRDVNLEVRRGEVMGLVGANGVGKTTLMSIISGKYPPDAGSMSFLDDDFAPMSTAEAQSHGVGIIEQSLSIDPDLTVAQAIYRFGYQAERPHKALRRGATLLLNDAGLTISPDAKVGSLHRAEVGLIECVRLLADDTYLVIIDEVGSTFNISEIDDLHFITNRLTRQGRSVLYISHRLHELQEISDRIAVMRDGEIVDVVESHSTSAEKLQELMFGAPRIEPPARSAGPANDVMLRVRGLVTDKIKGLDFDLFHREVLGICGPRGSGVSSILAALTGDAPGEFAELEVNGKAATISSPEDAARYKIGIFSDNDEDLPISREESIARSLMTTGWEESSDFAAEANALREIIAMLTEMQIRAKSIGTSVSNLSGGDQQRIALLRFMAEDVDVLVMHEPTRNLDVSSRDAVHRDLTAVLDSGRSAILVSSDLAELLEWSHRILLINEGSLAWEVEPDRTSVAVLREWLRSPAAVDLSKFVAQPFHLA